MTFEEAYAIISRIQFLADTEKIELIRCYNRVLAEDIISDTDLPPFDKSAMDGFACRREDLADELIIIEEIPAGKKPLKEIGKGECSRIMTGGMIPTGADFVMMKEHAEVSGNKVRLVTPSEALNICYRGEDVKAGDKILSSGKRIHPADMALMAATGYSLPLVYQRAKVAIISTGNELLEPGNHPVTPMIRNSNAYQVAGQVQQFGAEAHYLGIVRDQPSLLYEKIGDALGQFSLVIISGGVSVGDYDFVPEVLEKLGVQVLFHGLTMKPGKHFLLGVRDNCYVAGMPGNPVSSFVIFEVLIKPLLARLSGMSTESTAIRLPLETDYNRKKAGNLFFVPVSITHQGTIIPVEYHGSAHIDAYTKANGIMEVPIGVSQFKKGDLVNVRPI